MIVYTEQNRIFYFFKLLKRVLLSAPNKKEQIEKILYNNE
jgi:hypothetical protein